MKRCKRECELTGINVSVNVNWDVSVTVSIRWSVTPSDGVRVSVNADVNVTI